MGRNTILGFAAVLGISLFTAVPSVCAQEDADGIFVTVTHPILQGTIVQVRKQVDDARADKNRKIKKVVFDFNPDGKDVATADFGPSYDLAKFIRSLNTNHGIVTIGFVHGKVSRNTVLAVLACNDVVMSGSAVIGDVAGDTVLARIEREAYEELAGIHRAGAVSRMFDKDVQLVQGLYKNAPIYVDPSKVDGPAKDAKFADVVITNRKQETLPPGFALYNTEQAIKYGICVLQRETREEIARQYGLSAAALSADPLAGAARKACRIVMEGAIDVPMKEKMRRQIEDAKARKENLFFFVLECSGGELQPAIEIARLISELTSNREYPARTIAFVPGRADSFAIFPALACGELIMFKGVTEDSDAELGSFEAVSKRMGQRFNAQGIADNLKKLVEGRRDIPGVIIDGLVLKEGTILFVRNPKTNETRFMSALEFNNQKDGWVREGAEVKSQGSLLRLNATRAANLKLAGSVDIKDISVLYGKYGIEAKDVRDSTPSWLDNFAAFLRRIEVSVFLMVIGIAGLVLEMKAPGLVIPGVIAAICFVLFFWAHTHLGGQLIYLAIMLFILGIALLGVEIFLIPGFGITGVSGILLILCGLVLAGMDRAPESTSDYVDLIGQVMLYGLVIIGAAVLAFMISRYLPKLPYANRLMLVPPADMVGAEDEPSPLPGVDAAIELLGQVGVATSMLRPAGLARIGEQYIDVVTEGDFIEPGTNIQVVEVEGTRIVVKRV